MAVSKKDKSPQNPTKKSLKPPNTEYQNMAELFIAAINSIKIKEK